MILNRTRLATVPLLLAMTDLATDVLDLHWVRGSKLNIRRTVNVIDR